MKIGFSLGRCVRDIVKGEVKIEDVLVVIAQTHCETTLDLHQVIEHYMERPGYLKGLDKNECHYVARQLWYQGKLHQPRLNGLDPKGVVEQSVWRELNEAPVMHDCVSISVRALQLN